MHTSNTPRIGVLSLLHNLLRSLSFSFDLGTVDTIGEIALTVSAATNSISMLHTVYRRVLYRPLYITATL